MTNLLRMDTDSVGSVVQLFYSAFGSLRQQLSDTNTQLLSVAWDSPSRDDFINDYQLLTAHLQQLFDEGESLAVRLEEEKKRWEEMASYLGGSSDPADDLPGYWDRIDNALDYLQIGRSLSAIDVAVIHSTKRVGVAAIHGSKAFKKFILGLKPGTTVMGAEKYFKTVDDFGTIAKIGKNCEIGPFELLGFAANWADDSQRYSAEGTGMVAASGVYNALFTVATTTLGTAIGSGLGAWIGGTLGTLIFPGAGTVIGAAAGTFLVKSIVGFGVDRGVEAIMQIEGSNGATLEDSVTRGIYNIGDFAYKQIEGFSSWVQDGGLASPY